MMDIDASAVDAVASHARKCRPGARIMRRVKAGGSGHRFDILAVCDDELIAFKLVLSNTRPEHVHHRVDALRPFVHRVIPVIHQSHVAYDDGHPVLPSEMRIQTKDHVWIFPRVGSIHNLWEFPTRSSVGSLGEQAIGLMTRAEQLVLCRELDIWMASGASAYFIETTLRAHCSQADLSRHICRALRRRICRYSEAPVTEISQQLKSVGTSA